MAEPLDLFVVEDDEDAGFVMRLCLERAGHRVTLCRSGADALIVLGQSHFHLVVLDYNLDDMSGLDLLQAMHREAILTPVLMITGHGDERLATHVLRTGALDYVVKDASKTFLDELPKRIAESVTRHRLQQFNELLIAALESARDGIFITDLQGNLLHVNRALEQMFGYSRAELIGQNARLFKSEDQTERFFENMQRILQDRSGWQGELISHRKDDTILETSLMLSPIFDTRGTMTQFVGIYRDITERKQMERQLFHAQKMQSVGTLAGGVAHEFNNLLTGIQGYAALALRESPTSSATQDYLENIVTLADRAANLTRQLLAFARKPALRRVPTDVEKLLQQTCDLLRRSLNIEVALVVEPTESAVPWAALADAGQLQQVLVNLCINARDALREVARDVTPEGASLPAPISIRLAHRVTEDVAAFPQNVSAGDYLLIEVHDRGPGMPPEVLAQALDPFYTTKDIGQGTGLGLPVAFGIMNGHQGHLTLESRAGAGTSVGLYLPRLAHAPSTAALLEVPTPDPRSLPRRTVLVIDDEEAVLDVVRRFLEIAGHRVLTATSGAAGQEVLARESGVELVILDLMIPREEGKANFRRLRDTRPGVPVLLCTGLLHESQARELMQQGARSLIRKPFRMNELWQAVHDCVAPDGTAPDGVANDGETPH